MYCCEQNDKWGVRCVCSVDDGCDDWGVSVCRTASAHSVPSLELSSQRNELLRYKELDTRRSHEMRLSSGNLCVPVPVYLYRFCMQVSLS